MPRRFAAAPLGLFLAACASIGPGTVPHDRIDYASAIGNSWKEQTLLNIVKLRYADMPIFLEVAQVIAGYQLQSAFGGSFTAGNFNASLIGPFTATGSANAAGTYTDRPTVVYSAAHRGGFPETADDADPPEFRTVYAAVGLFCRSDHADHSGFR